MSSKSYIQFQNISKTYKDTIALDKLSFEMDKGDIFGYIGPNGAGKTTTIKILVGLITQYQGNVLINNDPFEKVEELLHSNEKVKEYINKVVNKFLDPYSMANLIIIMLGDKS